jgi:hypothetical protein
MMENIMRVNMIWAKNQDLVSINSTMVKYMKDIGKMDYNMG